MKWPSPELKDSTKLKLPDGWLPPEYYDAVNVLFRVENALRVFVYMILKNAHGGAWQELSLASDDSNAGTIASIARQRQEQDRKYGYLGAAVSAPLMYLTSGELIRLMLSKGEWPHFKDHFVAPRGIIETKLEEIGNIRNALAHFRPVTADDVQLCKTNARHVLVEVERCIECVFNPLQVVPTNSTDPWYASLQSMATGPFLKNITHSADGRWIAIGLQFDCATVRPSIEGTSVMNPGVLFLDTAAILRVIPGLREFVTCIFERPPSRHGGPGPNDLVFRKRLMLAFSHGMLEAKHETIAALLAEFCTKVAEESNLVQQDQLARGSLVKMTNLFGRKVTVGEREMWRCDLEPLSSKVTGDDSEFWGVVPQFHGSDWISETRSYPWAQPLGFVEEDIPF